MTNQIAVHAIKLFPKDRTDQDRPRHTQAADCASNALNAVSNSLQQNTQLGERVGLRKILEIINVATVEVVHAWVQRRWPPAIPHCDTPQHAIHQAGSGTKLAFSSLLGTKSTRDSDAVACLL